MTSLRPSNSAEAVRVVPDGTRAPPRVVASPRSAVAVDEVDWRGIARVRTSVFERAGWSFATRRSCILDAASGHYAWKRELGCFRGQSLPDAVFPENALEVTHSESGLRVRFGALEALRGWASADSPAPRVPDARRRRWRERRGRGHVAYDHDHTYTTTYAGGVDRRADGRYLRPNGSSVARRRRAEEAERSDDRGDVGGAARLRRPTCRCRADGGRAPFLVLERSEENDRSADERTPSDRRNNVPPWTTVVDDRKVDLESVLRAHPVPLHYEQVELYEDDLHDNGTSFVRCRVYVTPRGWVALLRCFVRVDGTMARVIDARYRHDFGDRTVRRERSWREGPWESFVGTTVGGPISLRAANDSLAARVLPLKKSPVTEALRLDDVDDDESTVFGGAAPCRVLCYLTESFRTVAAVPPKVVETTGVSALVVDAAGLRVDALPVVGDDDDGLVRPLWSLRLDEDDDDDEDDRPRGTVLSLRVSPDPSDGGRLIWGTDQGRARVSRLSDGRTTFDFEVAAPPSPTDRPRRARTSSARSWVERVAFSADGRKAAAAAGRAVSVVDARTGESTRTFVSAAGTVSGLAFDGAGALAVASYGRVTSLSTDDGGGGDDRARDAPSAAVASLDARGATTVVGRLDGVVRLWRTTTKGDDDHVDDLFVGAGGASVSWVGLDDDDGTRLAALAGDVALVVVLGDDDDDDDDDLDVVACRSASGHPGADGRGGTCARLVAAAWAPSSNRFLAASDENGRTHLFDAERGTDGARPRRAWPIETYRSKDDANDDDVAYELTIVVAAEETRDEDRCRILRSTTTTEGAVAYRFERMVVESEPPT